LHQGNPVSWQFDPSEKRLSITLPKELGGRTHEVTMTGDYTFTPVGAAAAA